MTDILMPKATAVWMVDNTSLTFEQIADFCGLHPLEVRGIADGDVARDIRGVDPITGGQLTREELDKAQADSEYRMKAVVSRHAELLKSAKPAPRYTPVSRRQDRPDAIAWFVRNHPEVTDAQISKLLGTTKATIETVRNRTHWNSANIKPVDPVTLGLVGQLQLDEVVRKAAEKKAKDDAKRGGPTLQAADAPAEDVVVEEEFVPEERERRGAEPTAESVFGTRDGSVPSPEQGRNKNGPGDRSPGPFLIRSGLLSGTGFQRGDFFLESELPLLELPYAKRVRRRVGHLSLDDLIQTAMTISQFADPSFDTHGLRLHV